MFISRILLIFVFLIPFLPALNLASGFDLASARVVILGLFGFWFLCALLKREIKIPFDSIGLFSALFLIWTALSLLYSPIFERTIRKELVFLSIFPLYLVVFNLFLERGKSFMLKTVKVIAWSTFLVSLIALIQFLAQFVVGSEAIISLYSDNLAGILWGEAAAEAVKSNPSWLVGVGGRDLLRAFATLPDPHMLSFFLAFGMMAQGALLFGSRSRKGKIFYGTMILLCVLVEFLTFSRGGYLGFLAAIIFLILVIFGKSLKQKLTKGRLLGLGIFFTLLAVVLIAFPENPVTSRLVSSFDLNEGSNLGRLKIWRQAEELFLSRPILGVGLGAYSFEIKPGASYREPIYAHNLYLEFLAETGILGFLFWLGIIGASFISFLRFYFKHPQSESRYVALFFSASLIWFSTHAFFEMPVYSSVILPMLMITLGLASALKKRV